MKGAIHMTAQTIDLVALPAALAALARVFGDDQFAYDNGGHYTCNEADAVATLLLVSGYRDAAITWLEAHAEFDDQGGEHKYSEDGEAVDIPEYVDALVA